MANEADTLNLMVLLVEVEELAKSKAELRSSLDEISAKLDERLVEMGFADLDEVRSRMKLPIQRLIHARKVADEQLIELARQRV